MLRSARHFLKQVFTWVLALLILFEQWGWEPLARLFERLARLPLFGRIERGIAALPPYAALAVFIVPALALLPIKLVALWLLSQGRATLGVIVIVVAKIVGTALVARLFMLTRPALMQLGWFARAYVRWSAFRDRVVAMVRASAAWRAGRRAKALAKRLWRRVLRRT
jgi:hypothetical protein